MRVVLVIQVDRQETLTLSVDSEYATISSNDIEDLIIRMLNEQQIARIIIKGVTKKRKREREIE